MKKIIALTLAAIMVALGLSACNKDGKKDDSASTTTVDTTTVADTTVADTTVADTTVADDTDEIGDISDDEVGYETTVDNDNIIFKSDYGFSFTYLAKYDEDSIMADGGIAFVDENTGSTFDITAVAYGEGEMAITKDIDAETYKTQMEAVYKLFDEEFAFAKFEETTVSGAKAMSMSFELLGVTCEQVVVFGDDVVITITTSYAESDDFVKDFTSAIDSLKLG